MLTIIKALLIIILIVLCLILAFILYVVFLPFSYRINGDFGEAYVFEIQINDAIRLVTIRIAYNRGLSISFGLFNNLIKLSNKKQRNTNEGSSNKKMAPKSAKDKNKKSNKNSKPKKKRNFKDIIEILKNEEDKKAITIILQKTKWLLLKLAPVSGKCDLNFSTGSPDTTGQLVGLMSVCPWFYGNDRHIYPDFIASKAYLSGQISIKGKVLVLYIIMALVSACMNSCVLKLFKKIL